MSNPTPKRIVFVCLGNICRSPTAEGVVAHRIRERGLDARIEIDSAGTIGYHAGERADGRMREHASRRGYDLASRSRQFVAADFEGFDLIVAMDRSNRRDILSLDRTGAYGDKVVLYTSYVTGAPDPDVPDPYYGGPAGFEQVLDLIEAGADGVIDDVLRR